MRRNIPKELLTESVCGKILERYSGEQIVRNLDNDTIKTISSVLNIPIDEVRVDWINHMKDKYQENERMKGMSPPPGPKYGPLESRIDSYGDLYITDNGKVIYTDQVRIDNDERRPENIHMYLTAEVYDAITYIKLLLSDKSELYWYDLYLVYDGTECTLRHTQGWTSDESKMKSYEVDRENHDWVLAY